jgi:precorrin-6B methylase 2
MKWIRGLAAILTVLSCPLPANSEEPDEDPPDSAIFVGTPPDVVEKMLEVAKITKDDVVYDLGCGDGRIVVAAAAKYGCRAVGYDIAPHKVRQSLENVRRHGLEKLVRIEQKDIFTLDLSGASVITLFLLPEMNVKLLPQMRRMKAGSRIVAHDYGIEGVQHDQLITIISKQNKVPRDIYLYTLPLKRQMPEQK